MAHSTPVRPSIGGAVRSGPTVRRRPELWSISPRRSLSSGALLSSAVALAWSTTLVVDFRIALTLLWTIGLAAAIGGLRYPRLGLLGVGMLCTLHGFAAPLLLRGGLWRWNTVNYVLLFVAVLFWPYVMTVGRPQRRLLLAVILLLGVEILLGPDVADGVQVVFSVVPAFGLLVYFRRVVPDSEAWAWLGVVTGVLAACGGIAFLLQQANLPPANPNAWSYVPLTALFAMCLAFAVSPDARGHRFVLVVLAMINSLWIFLSGSRGSMLSALVCIAFVLSLLQLRRAVLYGLVATLVSVAVLSQFTSLQGRAVERLGLLADPSQSLTTRTSGRFDLAQGAWYMFQDHPLGVGTGAFRANWEDYVVDPRPTEGSSRFALRHAHYEAHSAWMKVLAENGLPGCILLGAYVLSFTLSGWRSRNRARLRLGLAVSASLAVAWVTTEFWNPGLWLLAAGATVLLDLDAGAELGE